MRLNNSEILFRPRGARRHTPVDSVWQHKHGGVYVVLGHTLDTDTMQVRISYKRIAGPRFDAVLETGTVFSRPVREWTEDRFTEITG